LLVPLFRLLLAIGQSALLEEFPRMVVDNPSILRAGIFKWKQQQQQKRGGMDNGPELGTTPFRANLFSEPLQDRDDLRS